MNHKTKTHSPWVNLISQIQMSLLEYSGPSLYVGDMFQDLQWIDETMDSTKLNIHYVFFL